MDGGHGSVPGTAREGQLGPEGRGGELGWDHRGASGQERREEGGLHAVDMEAEEG